MKARLYIRALRPPPVFSMDLPMTTQGMPFIPREKDTLVVRNPNIPVDKATDIMAVIDGPVFWDFHAMEIKVYAHEITSFDP